MRKQMIQIDDMDTSTRRCVCGKEITWGDIAKLDAWMLIHGPHCEELQIECSADGDRILETHPAPKTVPLPE